MPTKTEKAILNLHEEIAGLDRLIQGKTQKAVALKVYVDSYDALIGEVKKLKKQRRTMNSHLMYFADTIKKITGKFPQAMLGPLFRQPESKRR